VGQPSLDRGRNDKGNSRRRGGIRKVADGSGNGGASSCVVLVVRPSGAGHNGFFVKPGIICNGLFIIGGMIIMQVQLSMEPVH
jgi:hypothetical protein